MDIQNFRVLGMVASVREQAWGRSRHSREKTDANQPLHRKMQRERETSVTVKGVHKKWLSDRKT